MQEILPVSSPPPVITISKLKRIRKADSPPARGFGTVPFLEREKGRSNGGLCRLNVVHPNSERETLSADLCEVRGRGELLQDLDIQQFKTNRNGPVPGHGLSLLGSQVLGQGRGSPDDSRPVPDSVGPGASYKRYELQRDPWLSEKFDLRRAFGGCCSSQRGIMGNALSVHHVILV